MTGMVSLSRDAIQVRSRRELKLSDCIGVCVPKLESTVRQLADLDEETLRFLDRQGGPKTLQQSLESGQSTTRHQTSRGAERIRLCSVDTVRIISADTVFDGWCLSSTPSGVRGGVRLDGKAPQPVRGKERPLNTTLGRQSIVS